MLCLYVKVDRPLPCSLSTYHGKRAQLDKAAPLRIQISAALFSEEPAKINIFAKDMVWKNTLTTGPMMPHFILYSSSNYPIRSVRQADEITHGLDLHYT